MEPIQRYKFNPNRSLDRHSAVRYGEEVPLLDRPLLEKKRRSPPEEL